MEMRLIPRLLPEAMQMGVTPGSVLETLVGIMQSHLTPDEMILGDLDRWFDPRRAPEDFLMMLAGWVGLERTLVSEIDSATARPTIDSAAIRELILRAAEFARERGTARTLKRILSIVTNSDAITVIENPPGDDGEPQAFHVRVELPNSALRHEALARRVVENWKPASVTSEIVFRAT
ncbi:MAG: phage tail protein [Beijerinckiaceae bacterium]|nr:phage tail protein [Beijerinckiaceae bacterium]